MKASLKFLSRPVFNFGSSRLICPCVLLGAESMRQRWSMCFDAEFQLNNLEYEGTLRWVIEPGSFDLVPGREFVMVENFQKLNTATGEGVLAKGLIVG